MNDKRTSKFLSLILRHRPEIAGITLDRNGWVDVESLIKGARNVTGREISRNLLERVVSDNNKGRFEFSEDGTRIRARQGHSVNVDLGYKPTEPPERLFHGTATRFLESIRQEGLRRMNRHHVHLSRDKDIAINVGSRHGKVAILEIHAKEMHSAGHTFYISNNGVWLTDNVPIEFLEFPD